MSLKDDLLQLVNRSYQRTWSDFERVKQVAISNGLNSNHAKRWRTPGEPALVSGLFNEFVGYELAQIVKLHLPHLCGLGMPIVSGVFVHQKPKVRFGAPSQEVELGDLLFVRHHFQLKHPKPRGWAFLMQAKHCTKARTGCLTGKEAVQFDLYSDWNRLLTFPSGEPGPPPSGSHWNLSQGPALASDTGCYGVVTKSLVGAQNFPDRCSWAVGTAITPKRSARRTVDASSTSLATVLEGFLQGSWGRPWDTTATSKDHWSHFVKVMLENAVAQQWRYSVQRIGVSDAARAQTSLALLTNGVPQWADNWAEHPRFRPYEDPYKAQAAWLESVRDTFDSNFPPAGRPPRFEALAQMRGPTSGLSVLYAATFGEEGLTGNRM